jgi:hypothetical protein
VGKADGVIHAALGRPVPVELTDDPRMKGRVRRLAGVSLLALGLITGLAASTLEAPVLVIVPLALGWAAMPAVLVWSLVDTRARYLLAVPSALVTLSLLGVCAVALPPAQIAAVGWLLVTGGVLLGGALGLWTWFRLLPVPSALDSPMAVGRWALIVIHVSLVVVGWALAATALGT